MRILAIANRVIKELIRDKRTLALMFVAPIIIILLLSVLFSANSTTNVKIGTVAVSKTIRSNLDNTKHVAVKTYDSKKQAKKALKDEKIDSIIQKKSSGYSITYANTDSTKTTAVKMAFKNAVTEDTMTTMKNQMGTMKTQLQTTASALTKVEQLLPAKTRAKLASQASTPKTTTKVTKVAKTKVTNHYVYGDSSTGFFDKILPILMGFFVFFFVFLISGMALLKERTSGTLDRLLATPVKRSEIVFGYMISYGILAIVQTIVIVMATIWLLGIDIVGNVFNLVIINLILALVALAFGILVSTFARSEFQMIQFIPLIVIPQVFFSGIIPLDSMSDRVKDISYIIPIKYSGDASTAIMMHGAHLSTLGLDIGVLGGILIVLTFLNIVGLKRYRKV
ncbi:ABC transporter permease [Pediococcus ethanolidurans]|uniref:ABC transporter permease n=1 Tax=Pediococcus ethanolidurans TaxID=319653 RepID=UPI001C1EE522|nr:ABC transporter permease [Pediococcus ethanolidurans]MBU7554863.1 ABC transporter permease [Pediococcus ethanolidurans]MBU7563680.1 ABC transporter permease [Pediococcus ethanolidurans]MCV3315184.1 ABC transporter permease [Pediococcus ethanolidurans]MCV3320900.1 ABC transporter permease [Pediococcus ethanolidurans]